MGEHPPATEQVINRPVYGRVGIFMLNKAHAQTPSVRFLHITPAAANNSRGVYKLKPTSLIKRLGGGVGIGLINGLLGAGGGMLAVPLLRRSMGVKEAHATSIAIIAVLSAVSAALYLMRGQVSISDALPYMPAGAVGAVIGAALLGRIPDRWLRRIFAAFMIWAGVRMWMH